MRENDMESKKSLIVFQDKKIRRLWYECASMEEDSGM
ncbi:MAG: hypothetical protein DNFNHJIP_00577 [Candidatus Argoarchaeum ethanivorans]|uniref:Uncharacterized protein n=1 Tax=Candidatus Argoarchaeum ethanivorans TaxID=2608793 RepID=A0A812A2D2_9EURY|nr:MAG: hypothetical protein DNFNHJIP_00577 [Candidatus Argoarchaeum ethanivorans]